MSSVLSIVSMFLPKPDSAELAAIKKGFEELNKKLDKRFDALEKDMRARFDHVIVVIQAVSGLDKYDAIRETLPMIAETYETFIRNPTDKTSRDEFIVHCNSSLYSPYWILFKMHNLLVGSGSSIPPVDSILKFCKDDFQKLMTLLTRFMTDAASAAYFEQACLGAKGSNEAKKDEMRIKTGKIDGQSKCHYGLHS